MDLEIISDEFDMNTLYRKELSTYWYVDWEISDISILDSIYWKSESVYHQIFKEFCIK